MTPSRLTGTDQPMGTNSFRSRRSRRRGQRAAVEAQKLGDRRRHVRDAVGIDCHRGDSDLVFGTVVLLDTFDGHACLALIEHDRLAVERARRGRRGCTGPLRKCAAADPPGLSASGGWHPGPPWRPRPWGCYPTGLQSAARPGISTPVRRPGAACQSASRPASLWRCAPRRCQASSSPCPWHRDRCRGPGARRSRPATRCPTTGDGPARPR